MKKLSFLFILTLSSFFQISATAQERGKDIPLTPEEKRVLIALFTRNTDSKLFRIEFNGARETYGARRISSAEMEQVRKARAIPNECQKVNVTNGIIIQFSDGTVIAAFTPTSRDTKNPFVNLHGKEKASQFATIIAKYVGCDDILGAPDT